MKKWLWLSCLMLLAGCGFQLRGLGLTDTVLPYHSWAVEDAGNMKTPLKYELKRRQNVQVVEAAQSEAILRVVSANTTKRTQSVNLEGSATEYLLMLDVIAQVEHQGMVVSNPLHVQVRRFMDYSDREVLGKEDEEAKLWADMRREAASQLILRIALMNAADMRARQ